MPFLGVQVAAVTTGANIVNGSIQSEDIANGAITSAKIASGAVPTALTVTKRDTTTRVDDPIAFHYHIKHAHETSHVDSMFWVFFLPLDVPFPCVTWAIRFCSARPCDPQRSYPSPVNLLPHH